MPKENHMKHLKWFIFFLEWPPVGNRLTHWHLSITEMCWMEGTLEVSSTTPSRSSARADWTGLCPVEFEISTRMEINTFPGPIPLFHHSSPYIQLEFSALQFESITSCSGLVCIWEESGSAFFPLSQQTAADIRPPPEPCPQTEQSQPSPSFLSSRAPDPDCLGDRFHGHTPVCHCLSCAEHRTAQTAQDAIRLVPNGMEWNDQFPWPADYTAACTAHEVLVCRPLQWGHCLFVFKLLFIKTPRYFPAKHYQTS